MIKNIVKERKKTGAGTDIQMSKSLHHNSLAARDKKTTHSSPRRVNYAIMSILRSIVA